MSGEARSMKDAAQAGYGVSIPWLAQFGLKPCGYHLVPRFPPTPLRKTITKRAPRPAAPNAILMNCPPDNWGPRLG
jgi:hypothetical protein